MKYFLVQSDEEITIDQGGTKQRTRRQDPGIGDENNDPYIASSSA